MLRAYFDCGRHEERQRREVDRLRGRFAALWPSSNAVACGRREERQRREIDRLRGCFVRTSTAAAVGSVSDKK